MVHYKGRLVPTGTNHAREEALRMQDGFVQLMQTLAPDLAQEMALRALVLERIGSMNGVKEAGLLRSEGKEYVMQDGDIVVFRFNV